MEHHDEAEIWSRLKVGDETALRQLFDRHHRPLLLDAARLLHDADACQDLVQDAFADLWRRRAELDIQTSVGAYLRRMVINKTLNYLKSQRRFAYGDEQAWADASDMPVEPVVSGGGSLEELLRRAIQALPEKCRLVFSLSRFEQMSNREIAGALGISVKTVENQMTKALRILRETLKNRPDLSCMVIYVLNSVVVS